MKTMTIRNVSTELAAAIEAEKRRGLSLDRAVLGVSGEALGTSQGSRRSNGLRKQSGSRSEEEFRQFEEAAAHSDAIDGELRK